jgi:hypothetical protein
MRKKTSFSVPHRESFFEEIEMIVRLLARGTLAVLLFLIASGFARADCVDGTRAATPAEVDFGTRALAALAAALPPPIPNSERRGAPPEIGKAPALSFCKGQREGDFLVAVGQSYLYRFPKADADRMFAERKEIERRIAALETLPPEKAAEQKALLDQARAAYDATPRRSRTDPPLSSEDQALANRKQAEGRALEDRANGVVRAYKESVRPQTEPLRRQADALQSFPQDLQVRYAINVERFPAPDGKAVVYTLGAPSARKNAGLKVHNVVAEISGPEGAARQALADAVDQAYLQGLVSAPLPSVQDSQARASRYATDVAATATVTPAAAATPPNTPSTEPARPSTGTTAAASSKAPPPCPPAGGGQSSGTAADAGAAIGGAVGGGGFGRSVGGAVGGLLGAIGASSDTKPASPPPSDCP